MRFGVFIPQGWRFDLVGIEPARHWEVMNGLAQHADSGAWDSLWVYDHFHTTPVPSEEATHEAWTLMAAFAATTSRLPRRRRAGVRSLVLRHRSARRRATRSRLRG